MFFYFILCFEVIFMWQYGMHIKGGQTGLEPAGRGGYKADLNIV